MKAREIIPGWPRGRSTSRPYRVNVRGFDLFGFGQYQYTRACVLSETPAETVFGIDHRFMQDWAHGQAEERRKADMMEAWYAMERRMRESGILYAKPPGERAIAAMAALLDLVERTK